MPFHLDETMNVFADGDLARPNKFLIEIPSLSEKFRFMAKGGTIPGFATGEVSRGFMGRKVYLAGDIQFEPWTIQVYNDAEFGTWDELHAWFYQTDSTDGTVFGATPAEYKRQGFVHHYKRDTTGQTPSKSFGLQGLFITGMSEIRLDWEDNNSVEIFDVTFRFDYLLDT